MTGLTNLVAAQLSAFAYIPLASLTNGATFYTNPSTGQTTTLPSGWYIDTTDSYATSSLLAGYNQYIVFKNDSVPKQSIVVFKGSDPGANFISDFTNNGSAAWTLLSTKAVNAVGTLQSEGYTVMTDGHSLGGGMAQTLALEFGLQGYGQNSLPISTTSVQQYLTNNGFLTLANAVSDYQFLHSFTEVNTLGDPATNIYSISNNLTGAAFLYTPTSTTTLSGGGSFVTGELSGLAIGGVQGAADLGYNAYEAHSINTVVSLLSAGGVTGSQISLTAVQADEAAAVIATVSSVTVNPNGSSTVTETNGTTYNVATTTNAAPPTSLTSLASGETYIFDPGTTNVAYTITGIAGVNASAIAYDPKTGGTLTFTQDTTPGLKLSDGAVLNVPGGGDMQLANVAGGTAAPEQTLIDYLSQIGDPLTAAQLNTDNYNYLYPAAASTYTLPIANQITSTTSLVDVFYVLNGNPAGAIVAGQSTAIATYILNGVQQHTPAQAYNELYVYPAGNGDLSRDTITGIQELVGENAQITLTQAQFSEFATITGNGNLIAATGGTFDLRGDPNADFNLTASDWSGTTLIGNNVSGENLVASLFGNDTLIAGNAPGDELVAGEGVDTMNGGTAGGDTFVINRSLADGSVITGNGSGNILQVAPNSDISGATVKGVQTLSYSGSIIVSFAELNEFSNIVGKGTITVADTGTVAAGSTLKVTGVVTIPTLAISGGGIVTSQGGTLTGLVTVNSGALMIGYGTINGADIINGTVVSSGGTLNITGNVTGSGTLTVGSGAINLSGSAVTIASASVNAGGSLTVSGADSIANLTDNGTITVASGSSLDVSSTLNPASSGIFQLTTKGSLEIAAILGAGAKIQFLGTSQANKLIIDSAANFGTRIGTASYAGPLLESFTAGDIIDLKGIASAGLGLAYSAASGDLQITGSSGSPLATLAFQNSTLGAGTFHTASDGLGGTLITHS
jgi:hypothetical protein